MLSSRQFWIALVVLVLATMVIIGGAFFRSVNAGVMCTSTRVGNTTYTYCTGQ